MIDVKTQSRIVKISIPSAKKPGKHWHFTGYVLCNGLIITCRHGFVDREFDDKHPIKIICQSQKDGQAIADSIDERISFKGKSLADLIPTSEKSEGKPVLYESKDFDVVLLSCPNIKAEFNTIKYLPDSGRWYSGGFPRFANESESNGFVKFAGEHLGSNKEGRYLSMTVTIPVVKDDADWSNASGSPIFADNKLVGILKKYQKLEQGSFVVGYLHRLWEKNDGFKAVIEQHAPSDFSYPQVQAKQLLENTENADLKEALTKIISLDSSEKLWTHLLSSDARELVRIFSQLEEEYRRPAKQLLILLLSATYEDHSLREMNFGEQPYYDVSAVTDTSCEFLMSAYDKRLPEFLDGAVYSPKYSISTVEGGINPQLSKDFASNILSGIADIPSVAARIRRDLNKKPKHDYDKKGNEEKGIEYVQGLLEDQLETYYWPLELDDRQLSQFLDFTNTFPQVKILKQTISNHKQVGKEDRLFEDVSDFLKD